jgi:hypothetical protein
MTILVADFLGVLLKVGEGHLEQKEAWYQGAVINPRQTGGDR